ncbi:pyridoxamine 5'-phosphate oxidase family protein [Xylophilus rhododendri]|uniref:Pyridoxamine 5'-phosphate oxidase family protein n=1 Tax=Xylophilus rhododendri TaxID=2697032 RepID=A0A857J7D3_9BURK|nr:pyridoxamine 5'-phosphate oxidase family protein [Xylophilus rhododendri]QHI99617.1 pyridoxamine 5'-phosphate oxidase family protein [Xylophilus rhododendri]
MKKADQLSEGMQKVVDLIDGIGAGMLTTPDSSGVLTSRPMMPLEVDANGSIWFFTKPSSDKQAPAGKVNLAFAEPSDGKYVSLSGGSTLIYDRNKIEELWSAAAKPWFPQGKEDPSLALLRVDVDDAEYWDSNSSRMVRMLAMAASAVSGKPVGMGENRTVHNPVAPSPAA